jgi:hypothetical protein
MWRKGNITQFNNLATLGIKVLTAVTMKIPVFWIVTQCSSERARRSGGTYRFWQKAKPSKKLADSEAAFLLGLPFGPEYRANIFLRNFGISTRLSNPENHTLQTGY